jgi:hypothetical protein
MLSAPRVRYGDFDFFLLYAVLMDTIIPIGPEDGSFVEMVQGTD